MSSTGAACHAARPRTARRAVVCAHAHPAPPPVRSEDYIESTYQYESTDVQMRNGKAVRARARRLVESKHNAQRRPALTVALAAALASALAPTARTALGLALALVAALASATVAASITTTSACPR
eukprot:scaffold4765_cov59-Phaeocystis_antarctica.AAC.2